MVHARGADRAHHAGKAQCIELGLGQVQVFQAPAHLLAGHGLALAIALLRRTDSFHAQHGAHGTTHVQHLAYLVLRACALAFVVHHSHHVFDQLGLGLRTMLHGHRVVAFGTFGHVFHIRLRTGPPHAIHLLARVAGGLCLFDSGAVHHTPAPQDHVVGLVLAHLQPRGFLLDAGCRHGQ